MIVLFCVILLGDLGGHEVVAAGAVVKDKAQLEDTHTLRHSNGMSDLHIGTYMAQVDGRMNWTWLQNE